MGLRAKFKKFKAMYAYMVENLKEGKSPDDVGVAVLKVFGYLSVAFLSVSGVSSIAIRANEGYGNYWPLAVFPLFLVAFIFAFLVAYWGHKIVGVSLHEKNKK